MEVSNTIKTLSLLMALSVAGLLPAYIAHANPSGATVVNGTASFQNNGNTLTVTNTPGAIINWQQFSIGANEVTRFVQQSASSAVLNRVTGGNVSEILGQLQSNGQVYLINPNGFIFGNSAVIDTAGLIASTLNLSNQDFLNNRLRFKDLDNDARILNQGYIHTSNDGEVVLVAPHIQNEGVIEVEQGRLILAAGQSVTISSLNYDNIEFEVQAPDSAVVNLGELVSDGGAIGVFAGSITNSGRVSANAISVDAAGNIRLVAQGDNIQQDADISASSQSGQGGNIQILGDRVGLFGATEADASGTSGGGEVLIGGDYQGKNPDIKNASRTVVAADAVIRADATVRGDGGRVIVWADEGTGFYGDISATGGSQSGDGGFVETSGKIYLDARGAVDASASNGKGGEWLLDPRNITLQVITTTAGDDSSGGTFDNLAPNTFTPNADDAIVDIDQIVTSLESGTSVTITTVDPAGAQAGDITVIDAIAVALNNGNVVLTLDAENDINVNNSITASGANSLDLTLLADSDTSGAGGITLAGAIDTNGGVVSATTTGAAGITLSANITTGAANLSFNTSGPVSFSSGTYSVGTISNSGTGSLSVSGNVTFDSVILDANLDILNASTLTVTNGLTLGGGSVPSPVITLNSTESTAALYFSGSSQTLGGSGTVRFDGSVIFNYVQGLTGNTTTTIGAGITIESGTGGGEVGSTTSTVLLDNQGSIVSQTAGSTVTVRNYTNNGSLQAISGGNIRLASAALSNDGSITIGAGSTVSTANTAFTNNAAGIIEGSGTFDVGTATLINDGTVRPGGAGAIGTLNITGNYSQGATGQLETEISTIASFDQLAITDTASIDGDLILADLGYAPADGDTITPLTATTGVSGNFASITTPISNTTPTASTNLNDVTVLFNLGISWDGGAGDGLWTSAMNWSANNVPTIADAVSIGPGFNVDITGTADALSITLDASSSLTLSSGTLTLGADSTLDGTFNINGGTFSSAYNTLLNGTFNWTGGILTSGGTLTINPTGSIVISGSSDRELNTYTLVNESNSAANAWSMSGGAGNFDFTNATFINNGTLDITAVGKTIRSFGTDVFTNNGTLTVNSAGVASINVLFDNAGTIDIQNGTLDVVSGYSQTAGSTVLSGGALTLSTLTLDGGVLAGTGTITGNVINNTGIIRPGGSGAVGTLFITGNFTNGTGGTAEIEISSTGVAGTDYDLLDVGNQVTLGGDLKLLGLAYTVVSGDSFTPLTYGSSTGAEFASIIPIAAEIVDPMYTSGTGGLSLILSTGGVLVWTGAVSTNWFDTGNWDIAVTPSAANDVVIGTGNVVINGTAIANTITLSSGATLNLASGSLTLNAASVFDGDLNINSGATLGGSGDVTVNGTLTLANAAITGAGSLTTTGVVNLVNNTVRTIDRNWSNTGSINWTQGQLAGTGQLTNTGAGGINLSGASTKTLNGFSIDNQALFVFDGNGPLTLESNAQILNSSGGVFDYRSVNGDINSSDDTGVFDNFGTVQRSTNTGNDRIDVSFIANAGSVINGISEAVTFSSMSIAGDITAQGNGIRLISGTHSVTSNAILLAGTLIWDTENLGGSTLQGSAGLSLTIASGADFQLTTNNTTGTGKILDSLQVINNGTIVFDGGAGGGLTLNNNAGITNNTGGIFDIVTANADIGGDGTGVFNNFGTVQRSTNTGIDRIDVSFIANSGSIINGISEAVTFGSMTIAGDITAQGSGIRLVNGTHTLGNGAQLNSGSMQWDSSGGAVTLQGAAGDALTIASGATLDIIGNSAITLDATGLVNNGQVIYNKTTLAMELINGASITNSASGVFDIASGNANINGTGSFANNGQLLKSGGGGVTTFNVAFSNNGGLIDIATGNTLDLGGATVLLDTGSILQGGGIFNGDVNNIAGSVRPGGNGATAIFAINGSYTQGAAAELLLELQGVTTGSGFDQLLVNGTASLDGVLQIIPINGFNANTGDTFAYLQATSINGDFARHQFPIDYALPVTTAGVQSISFEGNNTIFFNNSANDFDWNNAMNWSTGALPGAGVDVDTSSLVPGGTILIGSGAFDINTLKTNSNLTNNGAMLTVAGNLTTADDFVYTQDAATAFTRFNGVVNDSGATNVMVDNQAGSMIVNGTLNASLNNLGELSGAGTVNGDVVNDGRFAPGNPLGTFVIYGDLTLLTNSVLTIDVAGLLAGQQYDQLVVNGNIVYGGQLDVQVNTAAYHGTVNDSFQPIKINGGGTSSGEFSTVSANPGYTFAASPSASGLILTTTAVPGQSAIDPVGSDIVTLTNAVSDNEALIDSSNTITAPVLNDDEEEEGAILVCS